MENHAACMCCEENDNLKLLMYRQAVSRQTAGSSFGGAFQMQTKSPVFSL